ncbi:MAG: hypothetical protein N4A35_14740 [Flavobacteriales bacterium]|jgi:hypothetical protein|nr:hypothetical protein [Flavobacteriales bacterium]
MTKLKTLIPFLVIFNYSCSETAPKIETPQQQDKHEDSVMQSKTDGHNTTNKTSEYLLDALLSYNSEAELIEKFGQENVTRNTQYYPEGMGEYVSTALYENTPNEVIFSWSDDTLNFQGLLTIKVSKQNSPWSTQKGLHIGTTLKELEKINGKAFTFYGFEWDYAGSVNWEGGILDDRKTFCTLAYIYDYNDPNLVLPKAYEALIGDQEIASSDKNAQAVNITVSEITLAK